MLCPDIEGGNFYDIIAKKIKKRCSVRVICLFSIFYLLAKNK